MCACLFLFEGEKVKVFLMGVVELGPIGRWDMKFWTFPVIPWTSSFTAWRVWIGIWEKLIHFKLFLALTIWGKKCLQLTLKIESRKGNRFGGVCRFTSFICCDVGGDNRELIGSILSAIGVAWKWMFREVPESWTDRLNFKLWKILNLLEFSEQVEDL